MRPRHVETHLVERIGWLRAAVLGANDGIVSTASLVMGVAAANAPKSAVLVAGVAGLVAGAMSMAAGEYVSVSSQSDTEKADLDRERRELEEDPEFEHAELTEIYVTRGLERGLAAEVATQLMNHDALGSHLRDELGLSGYLGEPAFCPVLLRALEALGGTRDEIPPDLAWSIRPLTSRQHHPAVLRREQCSLRTGLEHGHASRLDSHLAEQQGAAAPFGASPGK